MAILNVHERILAASAADVGGLIDSLASADDKLWPHDRWVAMKLDQPLAAGASGGHGPVRYDVVDYEKGRFVRFRFTAPRGFVGCHRFEIKEFGDRTKLRHVIDMRTTGMARLTWPLVIRPLHNALIEDALDRAETAVGGSPAIRHWSPWVRFLRGAIRRRKASASRHRQGSGRRRRF